MEYQNLGRELYIRVDPGEDVVTQLLSVCRKEHIQTARIQGIGACGSAVLSTYLPAKAAFIDHMLSGMLEMVSLMGNVVEEAQGELTIHCHALFSYLDEAGVSHVQAGHLKEAVISYTGEVIVIPAEISLTKAFNPEVGIDVWMFYKEQL